MGAGKERASRAQGEETMKGTFRHWHLNDHVTRWPLANGTFIDRENVVSLRQYRDHKYEIYRSGQGEGGMAKLLRTCRTLKEAKAIAEAQGR